MSTLAALNLFLLGGTATACWLAGVFFFRFYRAARDRLFLFFALALWGFGAHWTSLAFGSKTEELHYLFLIRGFAFILIVVGVVQKNRRR